MTSPISFPARITRPLTSMHASPSKRLRSRARCSRIIRWPAPAGDAHCQLSSNCDPFDIMRSGGVEDDNLTFAPGNIQILQAVQGVAPNVDLPLSIKANSIDQYRRTFNLATNSTGIRENNGEVVSTLPEIIV